MFLSVLIWLDFVLGLSEWRFVGISDQAALFFFADN
jgi:hypothetical protein